MADREEFQKKLAELLAKAAAQGNRMTQEELAAFSVTRILRKNRWSWW